jgi:hypothetical protein
VHEFEVLSPAEASDVLEQIKRLRSGRRPMSAATAALLEHGIVWVPEGATLVHVRKTCKARGLKLHQTKMSRNGKPGSYFWIERDDA